MKTIRVVLFFGAVMTTCVCGLWPGLAIAQGPSASFPTRPITIVLTFPPGGPADAETRMYTPLFQAELGQTVLVENKGGAGGAIATSYVAKAPPDGYTVLSVSTGFTIVPAFHASGPYDPVKDFAPISLFSRRSAMLLVHPSLGVKSFPEYIAYAKSNPGAINYGTAGPGSALHIAGAWLHSGFNTIATFVHYKGAGPLYTDLLAGRVNAAGALLFTGMPFVKAGKLIPIANMGKERSKFLPDQKTIDEQGLPGYDYSSYAGYLVPAGTPAAIVNRLSGAWIKASRNPELLKRMEAEGAEVVGSTPEYFARVIVDHAAVWKRVIKENNIKLEE